MLSFIVKPPKSVIHGILQEQSLRPWKINYYLERRDPDFDVKKAHALIDL